MNLGFACGREFLRRGLAVSGPDFSKVDGNGSARHANFPELFGTGVTLQIFTDEFKTTSQDCPQIDGMNLRPKPTKGVGRWLSFFLHDSVRR